MFFAFSMYIGVLEKIRTNITTTFSFSYARESQASTKSSRRIFDSVARVLYSVYEALVSKNTCKLLQTTGEHFTVFLLLSLTAICVSPSASSEAERPKCL